jgi:CubicO group peptidase (beta-lactamase class C family)
MQGQPSNPDGKTSRRRRSRKVILSVAAIAVVFLAAWLARRLDQSLRVATGLVSHTLCSETFVCGLDPDQVYEELLRPMPALRRIRSAVRYHIDRGGREVRASVAGRFESRAVYRDGLGCIVVRGENPPESPSTENLDALEQSAAPLLPEIAGSALVDPANDGLRAALDRAFAEPANGPYRRVKAIVIVHEGRIVAERYAPGIDLAVPLIGYSASKSVINALIGILVRQGRLSIEQPAPVLAWRNPTDPRRSITADNLLRMTSGLALDEKGLALDRVARMLYLERDMAGFAESAPLQATPGATWNYSGGNTLILSRVIRDAVGGKADDVLKFAQRELFGPLGMRNVTLEFDATGTPVGSTFIFAPARDWARFGMLYLDDGVVGGRRILPQGWVSYSSSPTLDTDYGAGFWTNPSAPEAATAREQLGFPRDAFMASGLLGQRIVIIPSARLVIVRFGVTQIWPGFDYEGLGRLVTDVIAAVGTPRR